MSAPEEWYASLPPITRHYFTAVAATTVAVSLNMLNPYWIYLDFSLVFYKFQIWRLVTCFFFFGEFGLKFIFQIVMLVRYFRHLESEYYMGLRGTAEMSFLCGFGAILMIVYAYFFPPIFFPGPAMVSMVLYVWSRKDPSKFVTFWGFKFKCWHFPFVLMCLTVLLGGSPLLSILGIIIGHIYHFLTDIVPQVYTVQLLKTPEWVYNLFFHGSFGGPRSNYMRGGGHRME